jgi:hypothetical protein
MLLQESETGAVAMDWAFSILVIYACRDFEYRICRSVKNIVKADLFKIEAENTLCSLMVCIAQDTVRVF